MQNAECRTVPAKCKMQDVEHRMGSTERKMQTANWKVQNAKGIMQTSTCKVQSANCKFKLQLHLKRNKCAVHVWVSATHFNLAPPFYTYSPSSPHQRPSFRTSLSTPRHWPEVPTLLPHPPLLPREREIACFLISPLFNRPWLPRSVRRDACTQDLT